jgi:hypothetical protein
MIEKWLRQSTWCRSIREAARRHPEVDYPGDGPGFPQNFGDKGPGPSPIPVPNPNSGFTDSPDPPDPGPDPILRAFYVRLVREVASNGNGYADFHVHDGASGTFHENLSVPIGSPSPQNEMDRANLLKKSNVLRAYAILKASKQCFQ